MRPHASLTDRSCKQRGSSAYSLQILIYSLCQSLILWGIFGNRCKHSFRIKSLVFPFRIFLADSHLKNSFEFIHNYGVVRWVIYIIPELWLCIPKVSHLITEFDILSWFFKQIILAFCACRNNLSTSLLNYLKVTCTRWIIWH